MSNGNIWGSRNLPNYLEQVFNMMTWDSQMKMRVQSQMNSILKQADPVKFMVYDNQQEQVRRLNEIEQQVTELAKKRNGRFTPQDMMDINFLVNEFETWQNNLLGTQEAISKDWNTLKNNLNKFDLNEGLAVLNNYVNTNEYKPGSMLKVRPINPLNYFSGYGIPGRKNALSEDIVRTFEMDGYMYEEWLYMWATPEERESIVLSEYINNTGVKRGMDKFWEESIGVEDQQLWVQKMNEYNSTPQGSRNPINNPALYAGMKMFAPLIMKNTREQRRIGQVKKEKTKEETLEKVPHLTVLNQGAPVELSRPVSIGNKFPDFDYGEFTGYNMGNIPANKELTLDETTFITSVPPDESFPASKLGMPATEFKRKIEGEKEEASLKGQAYDVQEGQVFDEMPVYIGDGEIVENVSYGEVKKKLFKDRRNKGDLKLYKNQPIPESLLAEIESVMGDDFKEWNEKNIKFKPVALMQLKVGTYGTLEIMKVFDDALAKFLGIKNPEIILKQVLDKEKEKEKVKENDPLGLGIE